MVFAVCPVIWCLGMSCDESSYAMDWSVLQIKDTFLWLACHHTLTYHWSWSLWSQGMRADIPEFQGLRLARKGMAL